MSAKFSQEIIPLQESKMLALIINNEIVGITEDAAFATAVLTTLCDNSGDVYFQDIRLIKVSDEVGHSWRDAYKNMNGKILEDIANEVLNENN